MQIHDVELVSIDSVRDHPRNYREHRDDQLEHLKESIRAHGMYRNVVVARDGTILAGHGVVKAARVLGLEEIPVVRIDCDPDDPDAIRLLIGDNEIEHLGFKHDRMLAGLLNELEDIDPALLEGTGFDEMMLANLSALVTPPEEVRHVSGTETPDRVRTAPDARDDAEPHDGSENDFDPQEHWKGLPTYNGEPRADYSVRPLVLHFQTTQARNEAAKRLDLAITPETKTAWFPPVEKAPRSSLKFEAAGGDGDGE